MPRWSQPAVLFAVMLITVNAQCLAACAVLPCAEHPAQAQEPPCHGQAPAEESNAAPCAHPVFVTDGDPLVAAAALAEAGWKPAEAMEKPWQAPAPGVWAPPESPPRAVSVLRI
jgi:hypothetical protein